MRIDLLLERSLRAKIAPPAPRIGALHGTVRAKVAIVGGGFTGCGIGPGAFWGRVLAEWATGKPASELPAPVRPLPVIRNRWIKRHTYANAFRAYRLARGWR